MRINNSIKNYLLFLAILFVGLVIVGLYQNYSPVPYWDMWNGYLDFYVKLLHGDWSVWFSQHNEHRIFLTRLLFWIDLTLFDGRSYFLLICNLILLVLIAYLFYTILIQLIEAPANYNKTLGYFIVVVIFSWMQHDNITWGFQSQFFLAYLIPLFSFYLLATYQNTGQTRYFYLSLLFGSLSTLTMANGILALPLLAILSFIYKIDTPKRILAVLTTGIVLFLYFHNYTSPPGHGSISDTLLHHTGEFFLYLVTYLGGPFHYMVQGVPGLPQAAGIIFIGCTLFLIFKAFTSPHKHPLTFTLIAFLTYIGGTAFGTAGGRALFGIHQALDGRYTTPALMGWTALFILYIGFYKNNQRHAKAIVTALFVFPLLLLPYQFKALKDKHNHLFNRYVAALSLEMGTRDETYIKMVFPSVDWATSLSQEPIKQNLSIFADPNIKDVRELLGTQVKKQQHLLLSGKVANIQKISNSAYRITGWAYDTSTHTVPASMLIADEQKRVIGYVLTGKPMKDISHKVGNYAKYCGFIGYIKADIIAGQEISFITPDQKKKFTTEFSAL